MRLLRYILRKPSTTLVETIPLRCARCDSTRFFRESRTNHDLSLGISRRYVCRSCSSATLFVGRADADEIESQKLESCQLNEPPVVSTIVGSDSMPTNQVEIPMVTVEHKEKSGTEEHIDLRSELDAADSKINSLEKMLVSKEEEIANRQLECEKKNQEVQRLTRQLKNTQTEALVERQVIQSKNLDLSRHLAEAQAAIRINKEALIKARKVAYKASQQLKEQSETC